MVVNATTITAITPAHAAGLVDVAVTVPAGTGTGTGLYTYGAAPTVTSVTPAGGPVAGGTAVTITGTGFTGATSVTFGGVAATGITVVNATTITATAPAHAAGAVDVVVVTPFGGSGTGTGLYTYVAPPAVTGVAPDSGPTAGGQSVTITGTNFTGASSVTFGGAAATAFVVVNATTITATTPAHAAGTVDIVVTGFGGSGTGVGLYTYAPVPSVTSVAPAGGPIAGGTAVTITNSHSKNGIHQVPFKRSIIWAAFRPGYTQGIDISSPLRLIITGTISPDFAPAKSLTLKPISNASI
jgi:hypothetical protein